MHKQTEKILIPIWSLLLLLLFPMLLGAKSENDSMSSPKSPPGFALSVHADLISLKAENSSLKAVLEAIGQKMNIEVLGEIQEGETITAEFTRLPLAEALERLSPNYGYQMRTEKGEPKISKIFVLPNPKGFIRPKPAAKEPQIVEPTVSPELAVAGRPDEPESRKKDDEADEDKPAPFKFEFDPSAFVE